LVLNGKIFGLSFVDLNSDLEVGNSGLVYVAAMEKMPKER